MFGKQLAAIFALGSALAVDFVGLGPRQKRSDAVRALLFTPRFGRGLGLAVGGGEVCRVAGLSLTLTGLLTVARFLPGGRWISVTGGCDHRAGEKYRLRQLKSLQGVTSI